MLRIMAVVAALAIGATAVWAQNLDTIKQRRAVMGTIAKMSVVNFKMSKGETAFDLATLQSNLKAAQDEIAKFKSLFPEDSKTGGDTDASAKIWQARTEFNAAIDNFVTVAKAAAGAIKDEASLKAEYPKVVKDGCGGCHKPSDGFAPRLGDSFKKLSQ